MALTAVVVILSSVACDPDTNPPTLTSIEPPTGYPRQLLAVVGQTRFTKVVWDAGSGSETVIGWRPFRTQYFQIPESAAPGTHQVALRDEDGTSPSVTVTVLAPSGSFPAPRIEDIGILVMSTSGGMTNITLSVAAANLDAGATVLVDNIPVAFSINHGGLPINYQQNHVPSTFGYPIYHYAQKLVVVEGVTPGSTLTVQVTNTDGQTASKDYTLPATAADMDGDGDGLLDSWEDSGYTATSGGSVDLPAMGVDRWRKDILVEVDWTAVAEPDPALWDAIETAFDEAPVLNPDGSRGVNIIIDRGQSGALSEGGEVLADHAFMGFGPNGTTGYKDFFGDYKDNHFDPDRLILFHYAVLGRAQIGPWSGIAEVWGNDFMVTFAAYALYSNLTAVVGTFIHELGHNLGLTHGDLLTTSAQWNETRKPNFATTMSYRYQFPGVSLDCDWVSEDVHTYSQGTFATILEGSVDENIGICDNMPLDMNNDGSFGTVAIDFSGNGKTSTHDDFDQWGNMFLDFDAPGSWWNSD